MSGRRAVALLVCVVAVAVALVGCACRSEEVVVTPEEFSKLAAGMTLEQAEAAVGATPEKVGETPRSDGKVEERYLWANPDGSSAEVVLLDGKVTEKSSAGME